MTSPWLTILVLLGCEVVNSKLRHDPERAECNQKIREKYCDWHDEPCLQCQIGPHCPVPGFRNSHGLLSPEGTLLLQRGVEDKSKSELLEQLNLKMAKKTMSSCLPILEWHSGLADIAQAWADQCALVEYSKHRSPRKISSDSATARSSAVMDSFVAIAQRVYWTRTKKANLTQETITKLLDSDIQAHDGVIEGIVPESDNQTYTWSQATHVGCGWIQFPVVKGFDNFLVCNFGKGLTSKTSCSQEVNQQSYITFYSATSKVIEDVKKCLRAVRCRSRRQLDGNCTSSVEACLKAESGFQFIPLDVFEKQSRSSNGYPFDLEVSRCKIDTILCRVNASFPCQERLSRCLQHISLNQSAQDVLGPVSGLYQCECDRDLVLSNGMRGDCSAQNDQDPYCLVKKSPCVVVSEEGIAIEVSKPLEEVNGLIHKSYRLCENNVL